MKPLPFRMMLCVVGLFLLNSHAFGQNAPGPQPLLNLPYEGKDNPWGREVGWMEFTPSGKQLVVVRHSNELLIYDPNAGGKPEARFVIVNAETTLRAPKFAISSKSEWFVHGAYGGLQFVPLPPFNSKPPGSEKFAWKENLSMRCGVWTDPESLIAFLVGVRGQHYSLHRFDLAKGTSNEIVKGDLRDLETLSAAAMNTSSGRFAISLELLGSFSAVDSHAIDCWTLGEKPAKTTIKGKVWASSLAFSPDGKILVAGYADGSIAWFDFESGKELGHLSLCQMTVSSVCFHPGGRHFACASFDGAGRPNLFMIGLSTGKMLTSLPAGPNGLTSVCFNPSGNRLATGRSNGDVCIWDALPMLEEKMK